MAVPGDLHWIQACVLLLLCFSEALSAAASDTSTNYYETLRVEKTATDGEIKKAFRRLAVKYHPDKNKSAGAEKTFREIAEAYTVLSNKEKRRLYDSMGHKAFLKEPGFGDAQDETDQHFSFSTFFHDFSDSPFEEEPNVRWSFHPDWEEEDLLNERYIFDEPEFTFYFGDGDEYENEFFF